MKLLILNRFRHFWIFWITFQIFWFDSKCWHFSNGSKLILKKKKFLNIIWGSGAYPRKFDPISIPEKIAEGIDVDYQHIFRIPIGNCWTNSLNRSWKNHKQNIWRNGEIPWLIHRLSFRNYFQITKCLGRSIAEFRRISKVGRILASSVVGSSQNLWIMSSKIFHRCPFLVELQEYRQLANHPF